MKPFYGKGEVGKNDIGISWNFLEFLGISWNFSKIPIIDFYLKN